jgi:hypothetical protein
MLATMEEVTMLCMTTLAMVVRVLTRVWGAPMIVHLMMKIPLSGATVMLMTHIIPIVTVAILELGDGVVLSSSRL